MHKSYNAMRFVVLFALLLASAVGNSGERLIPRSMQEAKQARQAKQIEQAKLESDTVKLLLVADSTYGIQAGDILIISVWKEQDLQAEVLVRPDGRMSFPLAGDLQAAGLTVAELQKTIAEKLTKFIPDPVVTIAVKATAGSRVYVIGKVNRAGEFALTGRMDVMQALSLAGGATPYADLNDIRVLRREGEHQAAIKFRYKDVADGKRLEQNIVLKSGDTVVVP